MLTPTMPRLVFLPARAVEAQAVDHRLVLGEAEQSRARIALLRFRRHRSDLDEAEPKPQQRIRHFGVLVEACGHAQRVGKVQTEGANREQRVVDAR